jgi:hypothetical protein
MLKLCIKTRRIWYKETYIVSMGHVVAQLLEVLRYKPKVAASIPDGVIGIFLLRDPSSRTTALRSTLPLTEMGTRNISWGVKAAGVYS